MNSHRRRFVTGLAAGCILPLVAYAEGPGPEVVVYKDPACGCCGKWVEHMERSGFRVTARNVGDLATVKRKQRVPQPLGSCHTALVAGYTIEGHVPADAVRRLLRQRPAGVIGLAVPGMPLGSPGMESPTPQRYEILAFYGNGSTRVFERR